MEVKQIYKIINDVTKEVLGKTDLIKEDLTGVVQVGEEIFNQKAVENYTRTLIDHIGRVVFVNRVYGGSAPSVLMDSWEFGSIMEKIQAETPAATENETWELQHGQVYEQDIFYKPEVTFKLFNGKITFEVPISITDKQVKSAFSDANQLNGFVSMIYNSVDRSLTIKIDSLIMRTINNFSGETLFKESFSKTNASTKTGKRVINLLKLYNDTNETNLTPAKAIENKDFLRYASYQMKLYASRLTKISTIFNMGGKERFTPRDLMHIILLENFASGAETYLESDTFHNEFVKLPRAETVPYWQGSGADYSFEDVSSINIKTSEGNDIEMSGIIGIMFDRDALGCTNYRKYATTHRNDKSEFTNTWFKYDAGYFNDFNENFIMFIVA